VQIVRTLGSVPPESTTVRQRTWQDNADEFAALDQGEGWPFARLVACSVVRDNGHGNRRDRDVSGKVSATEFARRAETSNDRVLRYLTGWDKAAEKGWVAAASTLTPDSATGMTDPEHNWREVYDARKAGGRPRDSRPEDAAIIVQRRGAAAVVAAMPADVQREVALELGKTEAGIDAALDGYRQRPEEQARRRAVQERQAAQSEAEDVVYRFRTHTVMAVVMSLDAIVTEVTTPGDGREYELDDTGAEHARMVSDVLNGLASRLRAWSNGDSTDPWDRSLQDLLGGATE
jgi:hypothetical protein